MPEDTVATEQWLPVVGHEGSHEVSDLGRIRSVPRVIVNRLGRTQRIPGGVMTPEVKFGYERVNIGGRHVFVHRTVAEAFNGPCPPGLECCHDDGNERNNVPSNLVWDTHGRNMRDRVRHGTCWHTNKTHCPLDHRLVMPNLTGYGLRRGHRSCLACSRASAVNRAAVRRGAPTRDLQQLADAYYRKIMGESHGLEVLGRA